MKPLRHTPFLRLAPLGALAFAWGTLHAQPQSFPVATEAERAASVRALAEIEEAERDAATWAARRSGWRSDGFDPDGRRFRLQRLDPESGLPIYLLEANASSAITGNVAPIRTPNAPGLSGDRIAAGVWDSGIALPTHIELLGRLHPRDDFDVSNHATHVTGTVAAEGLDEQAQGMAPRAHVLSFHWDNNVVQMAENAATIPVDAGRLLVSNHSYVSASGWASGDFSGESGRHWFGRLEDGEDRRFGQYDERASLWDAMLHGAPYHLAVVAAGNDRNDMPPSPGTTFFYFDGEEWQSKPYDPATDPPGDGFKDGFNTVSSFSGAKNVLTVGAVRHALANGERDPSAATTTAFSSWGPMDDGRIKPDVVAAGQTIYSLSSTADDAYRNASGTSMAAPATSGAATLLQELHKRHFDGLPMRASTLRALLVHTADDIGTPGPDYTYGWGLLNAEAAARHLELHAEEPGDGRLIEAQLTAQRTSWTRLYEWNGDEDLRVTLSWTDPPNEPRTGLNDRTPVVVNDLDLTVRVGGETFFPFLLDQDDPAAPATTGRNGVDTVQQVLVPAGSGAGSVVVRVQGALAEGWPEQPFSLVVSGTEPGTLSIAPNATVQLSGARGTTISQAVTIRNRSSVPFAWEAHASVPGVRLLPSSGVLLREEEAELRLLLPPAEFQPSVADGSLDILDRTTGQLISRPLSVRTCQAAPLPYREDFSTGAAGPEWEFASTLNGRIRITPQHEPHTGGFHLLMDSSVGGSVLSRNSATVALDVSGWEELQLNFLAKGFGEDPHAPIWTPFENNADFDGVAISVDGRLWHEIVPLRPLASTWTPYSANVSEALDALQWEADGLLFVRFNQYDNTPVPLDGIAIDAVEVIGTRAVRTTPRASAP